MSWRHRLLMDMGVVVIREPFAPSMRDLMEEAASRLSSECRIRLCASLHLDNSCQHWLNPANDRVYCFGSGSEPPGGWIPSAAQEALWTLQARAMADGG